MADVLGRVLSTGYLKADFSPRYPLIPSASALVANDELVEGIQEPIAEDALRDDGGHVRAIDRILGGFRRHDLPGHEGMVQPLDPATHSPPDWLTMFSAVLLVNFLITDGVVVWRAWVISSLQLTVVRLLSFFLHLSCFELSPSRLFDYGRGEGWLAHYSRGAHTHIVLSRVIDIAQVSNLVLSLLTNVIATSIIATKSWKYRKSLMSYGVGGRTTMASKVLGFLVESGMLYIFIGVVVVASAFIRLCFATLGDILVPVAVQLAGIYPIIVLVIRGLERLIQVHNIRFVRFH
ncbi:hypothetical protein BGY98DRAFT_1102405 [Russula aff. rugulosa BPL654]|nr:hypothetical protein BGY98DRAFT_1102405 [Russula aff. rugulosa BPL654]